MHVAEGEMIFSRVFAKSGSSREDTTRDIEGKKKVKVLSMCNMHCFVCVYHANVNV